nr:hypothetical protein [Anaerolineae bacterium]
MDGPPKKSVVWVYSKDHTEHPFITLGANTLLEQGFAITVIDSATAHIDLPYSHIRLGPSFRKLQYIIRLRGIWRIDKFRLSAASKIRFFRMIWHTLRARPDTVIASHPFGMLAGWIAARLAGARFVYYSFEMYGQQPSPYKPL